MNGRNGFGLAGLRAAEARAAQMQDPVVTLQQVMQGGVGLSGLQLQTLGWAVETCVCGQPGCNGKKGVFNNAMHLTPRGPTFFPRSMAAPRETEPGATEEPKA
jgi:hypothetical protein